MDFIAFRKNKHEIIKEFPHDGDGSIKFKMNQKFMFKVIKSPKREIENKK